MLVNVGSIINFVLASIKLRAVRNIDCKGFLSWERNARGKPRSFKPPSIEEKRKVFFLKNTIFHE